MEAKIKPQDLRYNVLIEFEGKYLPVLAFDTERECKELGLKCSVTLPEMFKGKRLSTVSTWLDKCSPITLTEDILVRLGFEKEMSNNNVEVYYKHVLMVIPYGKGFFVAAPHGYPIGIEQSLYLHQLQNIHYSLFGAELTLNP